MATYKVIQDIEAEDKILGPLTLRQFVYAGIAALFLYLSYFVVSKGVTFMLGAFLPPALIAAFFAVPWGRDQPTEVWALAKIRFMLKPRRRIWDQSAIKELVTITAPKKEKPTYAIKNLSQTEVRSRLLALADTLDSRGWAVKNASINLGTGQSSFLSNDQNSDRLIAASSLPQQPMQVIDIRAGDDILDEQNNPIAQHMDSMIEASTKAHRQEIMDRLSQDEPAPAHGARPGNYWFLNQPAQAAQIPDDMVTFNTQVVTPGMQETDLVPGAGAPEQPSQAEEDLVRQLDARRSTRSTSMEGHMHTLQPISATHPTGWVVPQTQPVVNSQPPVPTPPAAPPLGQPLAPPQQSLSSLLATFSRPITQVEASPVVPSPQVPQMTQTPVAAPVQNPVPQVTGTQQAAILQLANNDDLNVATIARAADNSGQQDDGEVVIKLH